MAFNGSGSAAMPTMIGWWLSGDGGGEDRSRRHARGRGAHQGQLHGAVSEGDAGEAGCGGGAGEEGGSGVGNLPVTPRCKTCATMSDRVTTRVAASEVERTDLWTPSPLEKSWIKFSAVRFGYQHFKGDSCGSQDEFAYLMDSIYKRYPFGSLLFWRTREKLRVERDLGPFQLPEPKADYPIDYVLDGQQRITAIFGVFQSELQITTETDWLEIYFDLTARESAQDTQFVALAENEVDKTRHFPLKALFDTVSYRTATKALSDKEAERVRSDAISV